MSLEESKKSGEEGFPPEFIPLKTGTGMTAGKEGEYKIRTYKIQELEPRREGQEHEGKTKGRS
jgi:hypothetical protein